MHFYTSFYIMANIFWSYDHVKTACTEFIYIDQINIDNDNQRKLPLTD